MNDSNNVESIVPPIKSNPTLKEYRCPHCDRFLFKGNVKKLNMVCHHCQKMIDVDDGDLFKTDNEEITND
jgi:hypothetical protein